jgi:hypothetical protein
MKIFLASLAILAAFFVLMSVRLLFLKNGEFKGTCASQSPFLNPDGGTCSYCGKDVGSCENEAPKEESEVNKVLNKF